MAEQNQPVKKFRAGGVTATIWRNDVQQDGQTVVRHSVTVQKRYRDRDGSWKDSSSFFVNDLPRLELVVRKAYEYLALAAGEENDEGGPS